MVGPGNIETRARMLGWLRNGVAAMFVAALLAGIFLPIYTDEIGWRFQERAAIDGVDKLYSDNCGPNTLASPPFFMMPVRYYSAFFNTLFADPFYIRVSGVFYALIWGVLLLTLIRRLTSSRSDRAALTTVGFGLMCLGTLPLLLVWSRPEQPILLGTTATLILALGSGGAGEATSGGMAWRRSIAIVLLAVIAFSYHLKALFLTPVFLACLFFASRGPQANLPRLVMGGLFTAVAGWSAYYWIHRLQCPADPVLFAAYAENNFGMALTRSRNWTEISAALGKIIGNASLLEYFRLSAPLTDPMSNWVEPNQLSERYSFAWERALVLAWSGAVLLASTCIFTGIKRALRERRLDARLVLAVLLLATLLGWSATQAIRNVYEASFVLPLVMLAVILALSTSDPAGLIGKWFNVLTVVIGFAAVVSPVMVGMIYMPSLARASGQQGYLRAQPYSLSPFGYSSLEADIVGAARKCGIGKAAQEKALMIDDLTYFAFMKSRLPQHQLGVLSMWRGSIQDPMAYLRSRGSSGAIVGCHLLPDALRRRAKRQGGFCCLDPNS